MVCALQPAYMLVNRTDQQLKAHCLFSSGNCSVKTNSHERSVVTIPPDGQTVLLFWQTVSEGRASYSMTFTAHPSLATWSIPLSLNFVRRSFSLPCSTEGRGASHFIPCLLSTHESNHVTYIVISKDTTPRLLITNLCLKSLEVTEVGMVDIHRHPQLLSMGQEVAYEPPTLAKQYPLINAWEEEGSERESAFKIAEEVFLKLRVARDGGSVEKEKEEEDWSKPFRILPDSEQVLRVPHYETIFVTISSKGGTIHVSLIPISGQVAGTSSSTQELSTPGKQLTVSCHVEQLVLSMDCEQTENATIKPIAKLISDSIDLSYLTTSEDAHGKIIVSSLQVDSIMSAGEGSFSGYKVVLAPRREHSPPHQLVKKEAPPLFSISFHKALLPATLVHSIHISAQPITLQLDSSFLVRMKAVLASYQPPELNQFQRRHEQGIPVSVLSEVEKDETPVAITSLVVEPLTAYVSARMTVRVAISCDDMLLHLPRYELAHVYSNWIEVSNCLAAHYTAQVLWQAWWGLGSVDLIGSPSVLIHSIRSGLRDFFSLPYEGLTMGPGFFIVGLGQGFAALMGKISGGALRSLTNLTSSIAQNMEKLSFDPEHASYQEEYRRRGEPPALTSGLVTGASSFGLSMVSALAGVVDQPMRSVQATSQAEAGVGGYTKSILKGVGKGLLGMVTKPVGGALQLVSQTGQGLMCTAGLVHTPHHKATSSDDFFAPLNRMTLVPTTTKYSRYASNVLKFSYL